MSKDTVGACNPMALLCGIGRVICGYPYEGVETEQGSWIDPIQDDWTPILDELGYPKRARMIIRGRLSRPQKFSVLEWRLWALQMSLSISDGRSTLFFEDALLLAKEAHKTVSPDVPWE